MICDYSLQKSGKVARLLIENRRILNLDLAQNIWKLAEEDRITDEMMADIPEKFRVTKEDLQPIYDRDYRCMLWSRTVSRLINVSLALGVIHGGKTLLVTKEESRRHWKLAIEMLGRPEQFAFIKPMQLRDHDFVAQHRDCLLIAEHTPGMFGPLLSVLAPFDFPKFILLDQRQVPPNISDIVSMDRGEHPSATSNLMAAWSQIRNDNNVETANQKAFRNARLEDVLRLANILNI